MRNKRSLDTDHDLRDFHALAFQVVAMVATVVMGVMGGIVEIEWAPRREVPQLAILG